MKNVVYILIHKLIILDAAGTREYAFFKFVSVQDNLLYRCYFCRFFLSIR